MARTAHHISSLKLNEIPANFRTGIVVLKWCEDTRKPPNPNVCHLSIDPKGFYLICHDETKNEIECLDIALIHDTRTGSQVSLPRGVECFDKISFGVLDTSITSKWVSIYYGNTFVPSNDLRVIHFYFKSPNIAQEWAEQLFRFGHNQLLRNLSNLECLEKLHSKIINSLIDLDKKTIPIRSLIQFLCKNNRDFGKETKIRETLEHLKLPYKIDSSIDPEQFTFKKFFRLYMHLMDRFEVIKLFDLSGAHHQRYMNWENFKRFIKDQNDQDEIPFEIDYYEQKLKELIKKYSQHDEHSKAKGMCEESFLRYLLSFDNLIFNPTILDLYMDMNKPLSHYFISSSHNTYLTGSQFAGRASVEMYRQVLLTGCRCIELDVVDSERNDEPEIKHVYTPIKPVRFIDVIVAIREYAFKVTSYPLILSIENHCSERAQAKMAQYFVDVFRENLLKEPLDTHPCEENRPLPSPNDLRYKILIKNKKLSPKSISNTPTTFRKHGTISASSSSGQSDSGISTLTIATESSRPTSTNEPVIFIKQHSLVKLNLPEEPGHGYNVEYECVSDDDDKQNSVEIETISVPESKATSAMSDLVNYIVPIRFKTFIRAEECNRSFEMSSFPEDKAYNLIRERAKEFLAYNQRQLSRIYPRGTRLDSSNYNPYIYWSIGCQMVALNYQTLDIPMQLNLGLFSFNNACGYLEKPSALCQSRSSFDPRISTHVENVVSYQIDIKVLSGQFLCQDREPSFVDIQIYGMYGDMNKRHGYRVRAKEWNGFQAIYDEYDGKIEEFSTRFSKIILPEMAAVRFSVTAECGTFLGQCFLPITHLRPGYRHIVLRNQINIPVNSSSLFVFIRRNIYINSKDQEFADKLVEPLIIHSSNLNNEMNNCDRFSSNMLVRFHNSLKDQFGENCRSRSSSVLSDEYHKHIVAGSELNNRKQLTKIFSLNDNDPKEIHKREQNIQSKLRRISMDYQTKIEQGKVRFQQCLNLQQHETIKKDIEQCLLKIYSEKFHQQEALEQKYLNEYYKKLEKDIKDDFNKRMKQILYILKRDEARVNEHVRSQMKKDTNDIAKGTDKDVVNTIKEQSLKKNIKIVDLTMRMDMFEKVKEMLEKNLQINLNQLEEQRAKEIEICFKKYSDLFTQLKLELQIK